MIRTLKSHPAFRGLQEDPFSSLATCTLGRFTIILGRNGSGKTTFAELLRVGGDSEKNEGCKTTLALRVDGQNRQVSMSDTTLPIDIYVYNRYYVLDSLNLFLDGD